MMEFVSSLISNLVEEIMFALICICMSKPLYTKINIKKLLIATLLFFPIILLDITINNNIVFSLLGLILKFLPIYVILGISLSDTIMLYTLSYIVIFISEIPVALLTFPLNKTLSHDAYNIVGSIITLLIILLVYKHIPLNRIYKTFREEYPSTLLILVNIVFLILFISILFRSKPESFYMSALIVIIVYIIIIAINIELSVTRARIISQRNELDAQNEKIMTYEAYLPAISELINDVRERQHNYNDKLQGIYALSVTHSDYDSLRDALQKECAAISLPSESSMLLRLNLKVLAAFLFSKSKQAALDNKTLSISMPSPSYSSSVPEYILVEMIGILINNALEATPDGETVYLKLDCGGGTFGVEIKNPGTPFTEKQKKDIFVPGYTTKTNDRKTVLNMPEINNIPRGYGLSGLKKLTEKYDCDLIVTDEETENGSFIVFRLITNA